MIIANIEDKNPKAADGETPLHYAVKNNDFQICKLIIENVKDKNPTDPYGGTCLHYVAWNGNFRICELIILNVKDKNPMDEDGMTPLHFAASMGHLDVVQLIIENIGDNNSTELDAEPLYKCGYDTNGLFVVHQIGNVSRIDFKNSFGQTPYDLASENGHIAVCELINNNLHKTRKTANDGMSND